MEDRVLEAAIFQGFSQARLRAEISRAAKAAQVPSWSPHDLRRRRVSLWHYEGIAFREIGDRVGQRTISVTADVYTYSMDPGEVDRGPFPE